MIWDKNALAAARQQGWSVMEHGDTGRLMIAAVSDVCEEGEIVRFDYDDDAEHFVVELAANGDALAQAAINHIARKQVQ